MRELLAFRCPFCHLRAAVVCADDDRAATSAIHEKPICAEFDKEPVDYLAAVFDRDISIAKRLRVVLDEHSRLIN